MDAPRYETETCRMAKALVRSAQMRLIKDRLPHGFIDDLALRLTNVAFFDQLDQLPTSEEEYTALCNCARDFIHEVNLAYYKLNQRRFS